MTKNIAIVSKYFNWGGGLDFIHMLSKALVLKSNEFDAKIYLFVPNKPNITIKIGKNIKSFIKIPYNFIKGKKKLYEKPIYFMTDECMNCFSDLKKDLFIVFHDLSEFSFINKLKEYNIDIVLPLTQKMSFNNKIKSIGYIPDLQHKYYPNFFSKSEIKYRDKNFISLLNNNKIIIVNSKSVKKDIEKHYGNDFNKDKCKIFSLPFTPLLKENYDKINFDIIKKKYHLPDKYFIISNQMWKHKNHITAFKALKILNDDNLKDINIVCTGSNYDYRFPNLYFELQEEINNMGIQNNIYFLGYIPKNEQLIIMENSIAVIQPTLFEGGPGGGSVFDAVAMGVPSIVSDIDINREIDEENVTFFKTESAEDLALKMREAIIQKPIKYNKSELIQKSNKRLEVLSNELYKIIDYLNDK